MPEQLGLNSAFTTVAVQTDTYTKAVAATGTLTFTGNALNNETVTIDGKVYTFKTALSDVDGQVLIGATAADSIRNLVAAILRGDGQGMFYATSMKQHSTVLAAKTSDTTMVVTAVTPGSGGNSIATTETLTNASWGGGTLAGGITAARFVQFGFRAVAIILRNAGTETIFYSFDGGVTDHGLVLTASERRIEPDQYSSQIHLRRVAGGGATNNVDVMAWG